MGSWESPYLNAKIRYEGYHLGNTLDRKKSDNLVNNQILRNLELTYGVVSAHTIIDYVSKFLGKPRSEILSNYDAFSRYILYVYGEAEGRKILSRLPDSS